MINGSTPPIERLTALLGNDVFFVPCEWGMKKPLVTYVERPFEATKSEAYHALFETQPTQVLHRLGDVEAGIVPRLFIHQRCARLIETLPAGAAA